jgi:hypothetical protein
MFKTMVGGIDRILRIAFGPALIGLTLAGVIGAWGWIGIVPLLNGTFGTCPPYTLIGFNPYPLSKKA